MTSDATPPQASERLRLLLIDDDTVDRMVIRRKLAEAGVGAEFQECADAEHGCAAFDQGGFDAVLLDYHLPGANGSAVLRAARGGRTPIVVLSGQTSPQIVAELMKDGASDYLVKDGLTSERLATTVRNAVAGSRARLLAAERAGALRVLVEATAPVVGGDFFSVLARHLAAAARARHVAVAELLDDGATCRSLALWSDGALQPPREWALAAAPCREVVASAVPVERADAHLDFAARQGQLAAAAYLGLALRDDHGRALGTLGLWCDAPPRGSARASLDAILAVVVERAAAELLRLRAQTALTCSLRLEKGLTGCARALLADVQPPRTLDLALRHLLETTNASAITLFENEEDGAGDRCLRRSAGAHLGEAPAGGPEAMPYRAGLRRWENDLSSGLAVGGLVRHLPGDEQGLLVGVRTVLALPVNVRGEWVGFLRVDDSRADYRWLKEEVRLLRSGADLVGAYMERRGPLQGLRRQGLPASVEK